MGVETLVDIAAKSIKAGEAVWFGCDVGKHMASKQGILDLEALDYNLVFDTQVDLNMTKAQRLIYGQSCMNHAMVLTGVSIVDENGEAVKNGDASTEEENGQTEIPTVGGKVTKWRIENSWGEER